MPRDACYYKVKRRFKVWPSARASQALAKCRKHSGHVSKTAKGSSLRRWGSEKWVNVKTGRPCGNKRDKQEYCRPTHRVSSKTPVTNHQLSSDKRKKLIKAKERAGGVGHRTSMRAKQ